MTDASPQVQLERLRASLHVLEGQRAMLGGAIEPGYYELITRAEKISRLGVGPSS